MVQETPREVAGQLAKIKRSAVRFTDRVALLLNSNSEFPMFLFLCLLTLWGGWLLLPGDTFSSSASYAFLEGAINEELMGGLMTALGAFGLKSGLVRDFKAMQFVFLISFWVWLFIFVSLLIANWRSTGVPTYGLVMFMSGWYYLILKRGRFEASYYYEDE